MYKDTYGLLVHTSQQSKDRSVDLYEVDTIDEDSEDEKNSKINKNKVHPNAVSVTKLNSNKRARYVMYFSFLLFLTSVFV